MLRIHAGPRNPPVLQSLPLNVFFQWFYFTHYTTFLGSGDHSILFTPAQSQSSKTTYIKKCYCCTLQFYVWKYRLFSRNILYIYKDILRKLLMGSFRINRVSLNRCPPYTEIFSKRRKICSVCVESLSMTVNCSNFCLSTYSNKPNLEHKGYRKTYKKSSLIYLKHQLLK